MYKELLLLIKKHTDTLIEQTKTKPQETIEFKMNKKCKLFCLILQLIQLKKVKWLLTVSSFEATNSVFNITNGNNTFSITTPGHWNSKSAEKTIDEIIKLLELTSENDIQLHIEQVRKKGYL